MSQYDVSILPFAIKRKARKGQTLQEVVQEAGIKLTAPCGGLGKCGKCRVVVSSGKNAVSMPNSMEKGILSPDELTKNVRLSCQAEVHGKINLRIPTESVITDIRFGSEGLEKNVKASPFVKKYYSELEETTFQNLKPDLRRLKDSLSEQIRPDHISPEVLARLPQTLRDADWRVTTTVWNNKDILDVEMGRTFDDCYGVAIDLGTTKIVTSLVSLITGETIDMSGDVNPQISYGEDILSRIHYAMSGERAAKTLQKQVGATINQLITKGCSKHGINHRHIYEATVVCNTAMHHIFLGIFPKYLVNAPYVPAFKNPLDIAAKTLDLNINPEANIHFLPLIAGFVGSDCLANILATGIYKGNDTSLLIDIGTNTEVVLGNRERMVACSCASGPAFEGAHIKHGMKASIGAIESVWIDPNTSQIFTQTIQDATPSGLCGSGIIDCVAEMKKAGVIDERGMIDTGKHFPNTRMKEDGQPEMVIVNGGAHSKDIVVTQKDVNEVQLAKAAVYTGILVLMKALGVNQDQIRHVYISGTFGNSINPANAKAIGMIPDLPSERIENVGNAAIIGAKMALVSKRARKAFQKISEKVEYIELAAHPEFESQFIPALRFPSILPIGKH